MNDKFSILPSSNSINFSILFYFSALNYNNDFLILLPYTIRLSPSEFNLSLIVKSF